MRATKLLSSLLGSTIFLIIPDLFVTLPGVAASPVVTSPRTATQTKAEIAQATDLANLLMQADARLDANDYGGAVAAYTRVLEQNFGPETFQIQEQARLHRAHAYVVGAVTVSEGFEDYERSIGSAIADCSRVIQNEPQNPSGYACRGFAFLYLHSIQEAFEDYSKAIQLDPSNASLYQERGYAYYLSDRSQEAIADFDQAIQLNSNFADAYYFRSIVRSQVGDKAGAITDLQTAADLFQATGDTVNYERVEEALRRVQQQ